MKNKKVLFNSLMFFCSVFQSVIRIVKIIHIVWHWIVIWNLMNMWCLSDVYLSPRRYHPFAILWCLENNKTLDVLLLKFLRTYLGDFSNTYLTHLSIYAFFFRFVHCTTLLKQQALSGSSYRAATIDNMNFQIKSTTFAQIEVFCTTSW